jgi:inosose dehydratase
VKDFLPIIAHVHIKDFKGRAFHDGYTSVGDGLVNVKGVMEVLETSGRDFMIMAELNPDAEKNKSNPQTAFELAKASKQTFIDLGYTFR